MPSSGRRTLASTRLASGDAQNQTLIVRLVQDKGPKPFRVFVTHDDGKRVTSGYTCIHNDQAEAKKLYDWTVAQAKTKGWQVPTGRCRLRMLEAVPAPHPSNIIASPAPVKRGPGRPRKVA